MATSQMTEIIQHLRRIMLLRDGAGMTDGQLLEDYISRRDEEALAALVRRHAPMVWGVCRRVLPNYHDAEDAFQATFLVLVRKASSIASRELLANWLYGVAHQTALKARATSAKRCARERQMMEMREPAVAEQDDVWRDLQPLLDEELSRLPDKYRAVIVLCDLEGKTRKETARQLSVPEGTVASRLATARVMLAKRLAQRGVALSGGVLAVVLSQKAASAGVPTSVLLSSLKPVTGLAAGRAVVGLLSGRVVALTEEVLKAMLISKIKTVVVVVLAATLVTCTVGMAFRQAWSGQGDPGGPPQRKTAERSVKADKRKGDQDQKDDTAWGKEQGGLQSGLGYLPGQRRAYRLGETVTLVVRVRNVGKEKVALQYPRQCVIDNPPAITDAEGEPATFTPFSKVRVKKELIAKRVAPDDEVELDFLDIALKPCGKDDVSDVPTLFARPGKYLVRMNRLAPSASDNILSKLATGLLEREILDADKRGQPAKPRGDRELIQGKWEVVKVELSGPSAVDEGKEEKEVNVTGNTLTVVYKTRTYSMKYTLDPSKQPRKIDLVPTTDGAEKGQTLKGIYKLEEVLGLGDQLTICFSKSIAPVSETTHRLRAGQGGRRGSRAKAVPPQTCGDHEGRPARRVGVSGKRGRGSWLASYAARWHLPLPDARCRPRLDHYRVWGVEVAG